MKNPFPSPCHQAASRRYNSNCKGPLIVRYRRCTTCGQRFVTRQYNGKEHFVRYCNPYSPSVALCTRTPLTTPSFRRHDPQALRRLEAEAVLKGNKKNPRRCVICEEIMLFGTSPVCLHCDNPRTEMEIPDYRGIPRALRDKDSAPLIEGEELTYEVGDARPRRAIPGFLL